MVITVQTFYYIKCDVMNCLFMFPVFTYNHIKMNHGHNCTNILLYQNSIMHIIIYKVLITLLKI